MSSAHLRTWNEVCHTLFDTLQSIVFSTFDGLILQHEEGFSQLESILLEVEARRKSVYCIGNGASATICSHFAADINKNAGVRAHVFTDAALLTAVSNDISFERVYAEILRLQARSGDMLLTVSSSGNSQNILEAITEAKQMGIVIVTLSAMSPANASRTLGDINIYAPAATYGLAESAHTCILHHVIDRSIAALRHKSNGV